MKILILSTYDCYGAGTAAYRLHEALLRAGHESVMGVLYQKRPLSTALEDPHAENELLTYTHYILNADASTPCDILTTMSFGLSESAIADLAEPFDIINIHWANKLFPVYGFHVLERMGKRVVLTLHDENMYTGGCHYTLGCRKFTHRCADCQRHKTLSGFALYEQEMKAALMPRNAAVVAPSQWVARQAAESRVLSGRRIEVIQNGIDPELFCQRHRKEKRLKLGLREDEIALLFGSCSLSDERKGLGNLLRALKELERNHHEVFQRLRLFCVGQSQGDFGDMRVTSLGYQEEEQAMAELYAAADMTVIPSVADNLPNVMLESLMCGTPVAAFDTGGMAETIENGRTGVLAAQGDPVALADGIAALASSCGAMRHHCRAFAKERFSMERLANRYTALFESIQPLGGEFPAIGPGCPPEVLSLLGQVFSRTLQNKLDEVWAANAAERAQHMERFAKGVAKLYQIYETGRSIVVWGYGLYGKAVCEALGEKISVVADGKMPPVNGVRVVHPDGLERLAREGMFIFVAMISSQKPAATLTGWGLIEERDFAVL